MMATRTVNQQIDALLKRAKNPARTSSLEKTSSWVIKNKSTGEVIMETFDIKKVHALNTKKYEAVPILKHLQSLNRKDNPAHKTAARSVVLVAAKNPDNRSEDIPGDFSQSSPKVYGRAWTDAKQASLKDVGSDAVVRLTWDDGEWLQMVFDSRKGATKTLTRLGFK